MLVRLSIRDIVLIEKLDIEFSEGLSVLTGETGAGKSVLLDSLVLALGARGDAALVRRGAEQGQVEAVFDVGINHPARQILRDNGFDNAENEGDIILRRLQTADGRSRMFINDKSVSLGLLRSVGNALVEIHGQHADRAFADAGTHRFVLDVFGGLLPQLAELEHLQQLWRSAAKACADQQQKISEAQKEEEYLRRSTAELASLAVKTGEEADLAARRSGMMKAEKIAGDIMEAGEVLAGRESPLPVLANLARKLERKSAELPEFITPIIQALDKALQALSETQEHIDAAGSALNFDKEELEQTEERLFALRAAARKYMVAVENLPELQEKMAADLAQLDAGEQQLLQLQAAAEKARKAYDAAAAALSQQRSAAGKLLEQAVQAELPALKLEQAKFYINIQTDAENRTDQGIDKIAFWVQTNPTTAAGPLLKTASGGELSRFLLALKVAAAEKHSASTLIFDEIDTGVGGAVAAAIGARLKRLAIKAQVLAVTHAPQVAARADSHFLISKNTVSAAENSAKDKVNTHIHRMNEQDRQEEIARMLAGEHITDEARAAAEKLLSAK